MVAAGGLRRLASGRLAGRIGIRHSGFEEIPMSFRARCLPLLLALPCCAVYAQQTSGDLQQRMSPSEFKAAGLDKLSPQELQNLDAWLRTRGAHMAIRNAEAVDALAEAAGFHLLLDVAMPAHNRCRVWQRMHG